MKGEIHNDQFISLDKSYTQFIGIIRGKEIPFGGIDNEDKFLPPGNAFEAFFNFNFFSKYFFLDTDFKPKSF